MANEKYDQLIDLLQDGLVDAWMAGQSGRNTPGMEEASALAFQVVSLAAKTKLDARKAE